MKPKKKKFKRHFSEKKNTGSKSRKSYKRSDYTLNDDFDILDERYDNLNNEDESV